MSDSNETRLSKIWSAVTDYFKAPAGFERFMDKPVQPLPIYLTLQHLGNSKIGNNSAVSASAPHVGDPDDGGIYVGLSAENGKPLHAALADEPESLPLDKAFEAAEKMRKQPGRENAHVPTPKELNVNLYQNKDEGKLAGTFNTSDSVCDGCYRSSEPGRKMDEWRVQWFGDGRQDSVYRYTPLPLRLVW
jgi:hypothetical protein